MKLLLTPEEEERFIRELSWWAIYKELYRRTRKCILEELEQKPNEAKVRFLEDLFNSVEANIERLKSELFYEEKLRDFIRKKLKEVESKIEA